jgi:hypothetical protein
MVKYGDIIPGSMVTEAEDKKKGMTFNELYNAVMSAKATGADPEAIVHIQATWRNSIKETKIDLIPMRIPSQVEELEGGLEYE